MNNNKIAMQENEIVLYQLNDSVHIEVRMANESVWLTQQQIAMLFGVKQPAIPKHLNNIFKSGELDEASVHSILEHTAAEDVKKVERRLASEEKKMPGKKKK